MNITTYGAATEVTGSCYLVESNNARILVDCGLFQGPERLERLNVLPKNILSRRLDAVLLTHGHLDHCGRLPLLVKNGYRGPIFTTDATIEIAKLVMTDSARIQEEDTARENRKRVEEKRKPIEPLYTVEDTEQVCKLFRRVDYNTITECAPGMEVEFVEAGHILGSACVELRVADDQTKRLLVFSGDIGQPNVPILRDPARIEAADVVFMESTYGDRDHRKLDDTLTEMHSLIKLAVKNKGKVLIPTFAVGRAQQMLYYIAEMFRNGVVEPIPVFLDSPMAIAATEVYAKYQAEMDEEAQELLRTGQLKHDLATLQACTSVEESKALNHFEGACIILAGAGMCNAGRILHHLRNNLNNPSTVVLIVGYQPKGSLGHLMMDGATTVKIHGETVPVRATVKGLGGFSAHAGQSDLLNWLEPMARHKPKIFLMHGESHQMNELAFQIRQKFDLGVQMPKLNDVLTV